MDVCKLLNFATVLIYVDTIYRGIKIFHGKNTKNNKRRTQRKSSH